MQHKRDELLGIVYTSELRTQRIGCLAVTEERFTLVEKEPDHMNTLMHFFCYNRN